jgi:hypothetical protein
MPTSEQLAPLGMTLDDLDDGEVEIWPENASAANVFIAMWTQWRTGFSGRTGLDYTSLPVVFRMTGLPRKEWSAVFEDVRVMEAAGLTVMQETT